MTEPVKPFLDKIIVSAQMHIYVSQTDRGEFLIGAEVEPYPTYSNKGRSRSSSSPHGTSSSCSPAPLDPDPAPLDGPRDMSPDYSPIMGVTEIEGFLVDCGGGTYGFKAAPITGVTLAELIATGRTPS